MGIVAAKDFAARFAAARVVADLSSGGLFQMFAAVFRRVLQPRSIDLRIKDKCRNHLSSINEVIQSTFEISVIERSEISIVCI
jgi:hypothetical protein